MSDTVGAIRPAELRNWEGGVLYVKNNCSMRISFDDDKGTVVSIPHKGQDDSIQVLPIAMAQDPGFQKMWRRGDVVVSTDPAIEEELTLMEQRAIQQRDEEHEKLAAIMDNPPSDNDLVPAQCLHCQKTIFVTEALRRGNTQPLLCVDHSDLKSMFIPEIVMDESDGTEKTRWVAASAEKRQSHAATSVASAKE